MKTIIDFFKSVKLAIVLFILIAIAFIIGTLIPQHRTEAEYAARYGQMAGILVKLQFTQLYQSFWFLTLLFLFALNTITCTFVRLLPKLKKLWDPKILYDEKSLKTLTLNASFSRKGNIDKVAESISKSLRSHKYRSQVKKEKDRLGILSKKRSLGHFGSDFVHIGLLIIIFGGIISGIFGFRGNLKISEGQTVPVPNAEFSLNLEKFETIFYDDGRVKDWKSTLIVEEDGTQVLQKTIEVNHPLSYKRYVFYQSSVGWDWKNSFMDITVSKKSDPSFQKHFTLKKGQNVTLEDDVQFSVLQFVPDFILDERRQVASRSNNPNNPAALIAVKKGEELVFSGWIFANFPEFTTMHSGEESDLNFQFDRFHAAQYSGIQVAKDPGVNWIWVGCGFLMLGLLIAFYWPPREMRFILCPGTGKVNLTVGGLAAKNKDAFRQEFEEIIKSLRSSK